MTVPSSPLQEIPSNTIFPGSHTITVFLWAKYDVMDIKQLSYFVAVAEELNITRAATRLHIAQPPLSRHIQALEERLGVQLFVRTGRGLELTEAGRALLEEAPNILTMIDRAEQKTQHAGQGLTGRIDIGMFGSGVLSVIPVLLSQFHKARPSVQIGLHNMTKIEQIQALRERRLTIGFNRLLPDEPDIAVETVLREGFLVALPAHHPLCEKSEVSLQDLHGEPLILYPNLPIPGLAQEVLNAFQREGYHPTIEQEVEDFVTGIALVAGGFGLCVTVESASNLRLPGVEYRPLRSATLQDIELACLYRRNDTSPLLRTFLDHVRQGTLRQPPGTWSQA